MFGTYLMWSLECVVLVAAKYIIYYQSLTRLYVQSRPLGICVMLITQVEVPLVEVPLVEVPLVEVPLVEVPLEFVQLSW